MEEFKANSRFTRHANQLSLTDENIYQKMIGEIQDYAIYLLDCKGNIINWNKGAEAIKGYKEDKIIGKNYRIFYRETDQIARLPEKFLSIARQKGRVAHKGWRVRENKSLFWASVVITAIHDKKGTIIGFTKVARDLTDRKLAEEKLASYAKKIEAKNKQLNEYAFVASHDLQEPLRKIQMFAGRLEEAHDEETISKYILKIKAASGRMSNLIKDILRYAQLTNCDDLFEQTDLSKILDNVTSDYSSMLNEKSVFITKSELPVIKAIPTQMYQLFSNLLTNSVKFSVDDPHIDIRWNILDKKDRKSLITLSGHSEFYKLSFKDNGIGFEQQYADRVFEMFKRLTVNPGSGIGLAICKKIVENHKGHITANGHPGDGTVITVFLPYQTD